MENSARLFSCARCHVQVVICRACDRGNIYCSKQCSETTRHLALCAAGRRYQQTRRGRHRHAERQRRYRQRQTQKVTHQGSPDSTPHALLPPASSTPTQSSSVPTVDVIRCCFCDKQVSAFLRVDFLHRYARNERPYGSYWVRGP